MKKNVLLILIILSILLSNYYFFEIFKEPVKKQNPNETKYLSLEIKKKAVLPAIKMIEEGKNEEAIIFLRDENIKDNIFTLFYLGLVYFESGNEKDGLKLMTEAIKEEPTLYDKKYPNNVRKILEIVSDKIVGKDDLRNFRHLIDSKLKGGCG